jgi:hypothetical protein
MSSFIVGSGTINQVLVYLQSNARDPMSNHVSKALEQFGFNYNLERSESLKALGEAMMELNLKGVEACYNKRAEEMFEGIAYDFDLGYHLPDKIQSLKSLRCFLYQCTEGDIPKTSKLFQALQEVSNRLAHDIVQDLPQWEDARWG